jgi:hypothetical protein
MSDVREIIKTAETWPPAVGEPTIPEYVDEQDPEIKTGWMVRTEGDAEWALKRLGECEAEIAALKDNAKRAREWITRREAQLVAKAQRGASFFESHVLAWMERSRATILKGKAKSKALLYGSLGWKRAAEKLVYDDEAAALEWAKGEGIEAGLYRVEYRLEKDAIKAYTRARGVVPPGCHWEGGQDEPFVKAISADLALKEADHG